MMNREINKKRRLSEEDPDTSGVDPGTQAYANGQWRDRLRKRGPRRDQPEEETESIGDEQQEIPQIHGDGYQLECNREGPLLTQDPGDMSQTKRKGRGQPWEKHEKEELMWCFYYSQEKGNDDYRNVYRLWRERNPETRVNMTANTLQNQRRNVDRSYNDEEKEVIRKNVRRILEIERNDREKSDIQSNVPTVQEEDNIQTQIIDKIQEGIERRYLGKITITKEATILIEKGNNALKNILHENSTLLEIDSAIYVTARIITDKLIQPKEKNSRNKRKRTGTPGWELRLSERIDSLRKDLSILVVNTVRNNTKRKIAKVAKKWNLGDGRSIHDITEDIKQRIAALSQRLRRYKKRSKQFQENKMFKTDAKKFYRSIRANSYDGESPTKAEIEEFWTQVYEVDNRHNEEAEWLRQVERRDTAEMGWAQISEEEVAAAIKKTNNWKAAGIDCIPNFWIKNLNAAHKHLAREYNAIISQRIIPDWLAKGKTILLPKNHNTKDPKNYRPITCLNTIYKNLTSVITERVSQYMSSNNLLPLEQKGCCRGSRGCKDHLIVSKAITEDCKKNKKSLAVSWIDYKKAFDTIPHTWLIKAAKLAGIHPCIIGFLSAVMKTWRTEMHLSAKGEKVVTREIKIKRGIYQGDSLSPLLFCISLAPLTELLKSVPCGYKLNTSLNLINHLLYMDDLKIIASSKGQLKRLIATVKTFSDDIRMEFGLDKCAVVSFKRGKIEQMENIVLEDKSRIEALEQGAFYKYLGVQEGDGTDHEGQKESLKREYYFRVRKVLRTELNARNKISAIGVFAVPVIQYSAGIINWTLDELKNMDIRTRKLLTMHRALHPKADTSRLYVPRRIGGRGLRQIESAVECEIYNLAYYMVQNSQTNYLLEAVVHHDKAQQHHSIIEKALRLARRVKSEEEPEPTAEVMPLPKVTVSRSRNELVAIWKKKPLHGELVTAMERIRFDRDASYAWLKQGFLKPETESILIAAQDQALKTRYIEHRIMKTRNDEKCRMCDERSETVGHIMSACTILALKEYIDRHNQVCVLIHHQILQHYKCAPLEKEWYKHKPQGVTNSPDGKVTILYDHPIRTDRTMTGQEEGEAPNRPDIVVREEKVTYLIDVAVPADTNIIKKEANKKLKYKSLSIEIQRMWRTKVKIIPIIIGTTGYVTQEYERYVKQLPGEHSVEKIQQTAILGTAHILRKVLS